MIIERILKTYINWEYVNKLLDNVILVCEFPVLENVFLTIERNYDSKLKSNSHCVYNQSKFSLDF